MTVTAVAEGVELAVLGHLLFDQVAGLVLMAALDSGEVGETVGLLVVKGLEGIVIVVEDLLLLD